MNVGVLTSTCFETVAEYKQIPNLDPFMGCPIVQERRRRQATGKQKGKAKNGKHRERKTKGKGNNNTN